MKKTERVLLYQAIMQSNLHPTTKSFLGQVLKNYQTVTPDMRNAMGPTGPYTPDMFQDFVRDNKKMGSEDGGRVITGLHPQDTPAAFGDLTGQPGMTDEDLSGDDLYAYLEDTGYYDGGPGGDGHGGRD